MYGISAWSWAYHWEATTTSNNSKIAISQLTAAGGRRRGRACFGSFAGGGGDVGGCIV